MSCVFTRKLNREPQQYSTYYLYKVSMVCTMTVHRPTLISMPFPHIYYSSPIHLPQGIICKSTCLEIHLHGEVISKSHKPAFHGGYFSRNISYGGAAIIWVFRLPQWGYSYPTQSSMTELLLSVSQH